MKKTFTGAIVLAGSFLLFVGAASAATVVVSPSNMNGWQIENYHTPDNGNTYIDEGSATTSDGTGGYFVDGPGTPPLGVGSFQELVGTTGNDGTLMDTSAYNGMPLSSITQLSYDTYVQQNMGEQATYLAINISTTTGATTDTIFFEPVYQNGTYVPLLPYATTPVPNQCGSNPNCVSLDTWQSWNAQEGGWWSNNDSAGGPPLTTLADYEKEYPNAEIATDGPSVAVQAGFGSGAWNNFIGNFDDLTINGTTYDFDPSPAATPSVTTLAATNVTSSDATMNAMNGPVAAGQESFWVSTNTPINTSSPNIPAGVYSTPVLPGVGAGASFQDQLSLVTTNGIVTGGNPGNMPAITPGTTYYYVAWVNVGGTWYPGNQESVTIPLPGVTTNSATGETTSGATLNGTVGSTNAANTSFWWGNTAPTTPITTPGSNPAATSEFPAGWVHDSGLGPVTAGSSFSENTSTMGPLTPGNTYYFVAWVEVGGIWYPGQTLSFVVPMTAGMCPANLVPAASPLQTVMVNSDSDTPTPSMALTNGQSYLLESSGTWQNSTLNVADSMYSSLNSWTNYQEGYDTNPYFLGPNEFNLEVNGAFTNWGPYSASHNYSSPYTGTGSAVNFMVFDGNSNSGAAASNASWYGDNSGTLSVAIYQCVVPPPPANACSTPNSAPAGYTLVKGTTTNETITLANDSMFVSDGNGNNTIKGGAGNYVVCTGSGNDSISLGAGSDTITDTGGNNTVTAGAGNDNISLAGTGNNTVTAGNGNETVTVGNGNNKVTTGNGTSTITAGNGNNTISTGTGLQTITVGNGNNGITTQSTGNTIHTGTGHNTIHQ